MPLSPNQIAPHQAHAYLCPELELDDLDWCLLESDPGYALRLDQQPESLDGVRYLGYIAARGLGKTFACRARVQELVDSGQVKSIALLAQDEQRCYDLQVSALLEGAPPWNKASEFKGKVVWDNGAIAHVYTPEAPGKIRGGNFDLAWLTEIVAWNDHSGPEAFANVLTATRNREGLVVLWDTTSKGYSEVLDTLIKFNARDPRAYPILRGQTFDNPALPRSYLLEQVELYGRGTRAYREEILGEVFDSHEGALWQKAWIDDNRVLRSPPLVQKLIGFDPNTSERATADAAGIIVGGVDAMGQLYVLKDRSAKHSIESVGHVILDEHADGAVGAVIETNRGNKYIAQNIRATAQTRNVQVRILDPKDSFPHRWDPNVIYLREVHSRGHKLERAEPIVTMYANGRVHHVGTLPDLERQQLTYNGTGESPNAYDAANLVLAELGGLRVDKPTRAAQAARLKGERNLHDELVSRLGIHRKSRSIT